MPTEVTIVLHDPRGRDEEYWTRKIESLQDLELIEAEVIVIQVI